jgi:hypothetical protein
MLIFVLRILVRQVTSSRLQTHLHPYMGAYAAAAVLIYTNIAAGSILLLQY